MITHKTGLTQWAVLAVALIFGAFLVAGPVAAKEQKGEVVIATQWQTFYQIGGDPVTHYAGAPVVNHTVFESWIWPTWERKPIPAIATSWKIAPGWKYMDIIIRTDVKFHNSQPVTAEDMKYSFEQYLRKDQKFLFAPIWRRNIKQFEIVAPDHIRVHFEKADWGFLGRMWWGAGFFPKAYREQVGDKGFAEHPIGAGPFKWHSYKQDQWIKIEALEHHYRKTPEYKYLKFLYTPEHSTRVAMLKAGEADIAYLIGPNVPQVQADPNLRIIWSKFVIGQALAYCDLAFPKDPSPFLDERVRQAASLAVDRKTICDKLFFGGAEPIGDIISPITLGFDKDIQPDPYDLEKAKKLLAEAGYPQGFETTISTTPGNKYWIEAITSSLSEVGIRAKLELFEGGSWAEAFRGKKLHGLATTSAWYDAEYQAPADMSDHWLKGMPWCYNTTDEIDAAVRQGMYAENDEQLAEWGRKISKIARAADTRMILWGLHTPYGIGPKIEYWRPQIGALPPSAYEYIRIKD